MQHRPGSVSQQTSPVGGANPPHRLPLLHASCTSGCSSEHATPSLSRSSPLLPRLLSLLCSCWSCTPQPACTQVRSGRCSCPPRPPATQRTLCTAACHPSPARTCLPMSRRAAAPCTTAVSACRSTAGPATMCRSSGLAGAPFTNEQPPEHLLALCLPLATSMRAFQLPQLSSCHC